MEMINKLMKLFNKFLIKLRLLMAKSKEINRIYKSKKNKQENRTLLRSLKNKLVLRPELKSTIKFINKNKLL